MKPLSYKTWIWLAIGGLGILLPIVFSAVTYTFVSIGSNPISLDDQQSLILSLALLKLVILGGTGVFPIDLNKLFSKYYEALGKEKRSVSENSVVLADPDRLYRVPAIEQCPCTRRFLCEMETAARTSDKYEESLPQAVNGRNPDEEVAPEDVDPLTEMHIEAVKAFYKEENPTGDLTPATSRALGLMEGLTGDSCEKAYKLCPGRFTAPMIFKIVFDEINYTVHDEL